MQEYFAVFYANIIDEDGKNKGRYRIEEGLFPAKDWDHANEKAKARVRELQESSGFSNVAIGGLESIAEGEFTLRPDASQERIIN